MARVLVVDDNAANRELLRACLEPAEHEVLEADSGEAALALAAEAPPDLVLLDVMMPGLNGFQTTALLKERAAGFLPVILVSALNDASSKVLGLRVGADDFLTKPVDRFEMTARVGNLLKLRSKERELEERNARMVDLQQFRDEMAALIVHDLKNPMSVVMANLDFVLEDPRTETLPDLRDALDDARRGGKRALRLLANLLDLARLEANRLELSRTTITLHDLVAPVLAERARMFAGRELVVDAQLSRDPVWVDADLFTRVIENVLDNAMRYTPAQGRISVSVERQGQMIWLRVGNSGPPVPASHRQRIFEKFGQAEGSQRTNLGLGLYFCRLVLEAHGGQLSLGEAPGLPTVFLFSLPLADRLADR